MSYLGLIRLILVIVFTYIIIDEIGYRAWRKQNPGAQWSHLRGRFGPMVDPWRKSSVFMKEEDASRRLYSVLDQ